MLQRTLLITLLGLLPAPALAQGEVIQDYWAVMQTKGHDLGYVRTKIARVQRDGVELYETTVETHMSMKRLGAEVSVKQSGTTLETADGAPVFMSFAMDMSNQQSEAEIEFEDGTARIRSTLMGRTRERSVSYPAETVGSWGLLQLTQKSGYEPGTVIECTTFIAEQQKASDVYIEVFGPEEIEVMDGPTRTLTKVVTEMDAMPVPITTWVDEDGVPIKSLVPIAGLKLEVNVASKERALASLEQKEEAPDVFTDTMIVAKHHVPFPRFLDGAVLEVSPRSDGGLDLHADSKQTVGAPDGRGSVQVRVRRYLPPADHKGVRPLRDVTDELEPALTASTMIQSDEAELVEIAESVVGDETDAWKAAQTLESWVHQNVTEKGFDVGFASALEVCRDRKGDCSEHAVFLAGLCRAAGIPSRVAMGVMYIGGIWGGHAWNEVWIDGDWYPLDATLGFGSADPLRVTFASMNMQDGDDGFATLLKSLGTVDIRVLEVSRGGETIEVSADAIRIDGNRYHNDMWDLSCVKPDGFEFDPETPRAAIDFDLLEIEEKDGDTVFEISAIDLPSDFSWDTMLEKVTGTGGKVEEIEVDGHSGKRVYRGDRQLVMVPTDRALYLIEMRDGDGKADDKLFATFVASVDFDAE